MSLPTIAEKISRNPDPYDMAIAHFELRTLDRVERTVTFHFADDSKLVFQITYEVKNCD